MDSQSSASLAIHSVVYQPLQSREGYWKPRKTTFVGWLWVPVRIHWTTYFRELSAWNYGQLPKIPGLEVLLWRHYQLRINSTVTADSFSWTKSMARITPITFLWLERADCFLCLVAMAKDKVWGTRLIGLKRSISSLLKPSTTFPNCTWRGREKVLKEITPSSDFVESWVRVAGMALALGNQNNPRSLGLFE